LGEKEDGKKTLNQVCVCGVACQASQKLCERFSIRYYPSLLWALPPVLAIGSRSAKIQSPLEEITNAQTAEALLEQINKRIGKCVPTP